MDDIYRVSSSESSTVVFYVDIVLMFNNHRIRFHFIIIFQHKQRIVLSFDIVNNSLIFFMTVG